MHMKIYPAPGLYSDTVIGTLAVDWWTFGTARRGLGGLMVNDNEKYNEYGKTS